MFTPDKGAGPHELHQAWSKQPLRQRGISMIELIVFIVIVGLGVAGILVIFTVTTKNSPEPLIQKQMLAIAESLLEEVQAKPFTFCDPDDAQASTAQSAIIDPATGCALRVEAMGPDSAFGTQATAETRISATAPFDNVNDYGVASGLPLTISPISDMTGANVAGLGAYSATIQVAAVALGAVVPSTSALQITVTVTGPGNRTLALQGYRTRYSPRAVP